MSYILSKKFRKENWTFLCYNIKVFYLEPMNDWYSSPCIRYKIIQPIKGQKIFQDKSAEYSSDFTIDIFSVLDSTTYYGPPRGNTNTIICTLSWFHENLTVWKEYSNMFWMDFFGKKVVPISVNRIELTYIVQKLAPIESYN